jgi:hypothetical protein
MNTQIPVASWGVRGQLNEHWCSKCAAMCADVLRRAAVGLADCCPDSRNMGPDFGASMFACHQSKQGAEITCAGWMATVGNRHPGVRLAVAMGRLDAPALQVGDGWPDLHQNYQQVLGKLQASGPAEQVNCIPEES